jgi:ribosomal protein S18 acetylase RimI-like enzyme
VTVEVRAAREADLPALLALYGELHPSDAPLPAARAAALWTEIVAQAGRTVWVAVIAETLVGTADCSILANLTRGGSPFMLIENVVVASAARRGGIGRALMDTAVATATAAGCYKVQLLSRADRAPAHRFYESCGFRTLAAGYRLYL